MTHNTRTRNRHPLGSRPLRGGKQRSGEAIGTGWRVCPICAGEYKLGDKCPKCGRQ